MKKMPIYYSILVCMLISINTLAGNTNIKKADKYYEDLAYSKAIGIYEKIIKKDSSNVHVLQRLADSYFQMDEYDRAFKYYEMLARVDQSLPVGVYRYGFLLIGKARYKEAGQWLKKYLEMEPNDRRAKIQLEQIDQIENLKSNTTKYQVNLVDGNTQYIDMSPVYYKNQLVFASSRDSFSISMKNHEWNNQPFLDLYLSKDDKSLVEASKLTGNINTRYHEGPTCFSKDGKTAYFTRNNYFDKKVNTTSKGVNNLKLYIATYDGIKWNEISEFPYNSNEYSLGHAALSVDEKTIYFASDMPGSFGETDIYKSTLIDGQWSKPVNLGPSVNTEGKEMFPYVDNNGVLYFSSDGLPGIGGLDIYAAFENSDKRFLSINLGTPVNSQYDDFGYIIDTEKLSGYFTSNRPGGVGYDDIYHFQITGMELTVTTYFENTGEKLPQTTVVLKSSDGKTNEKKVSNAEATTNFIVKPGKTYQLIGEKNGYIGASKEITVQGSLPVNTKSETLYLKQEMKPVLTLLTVKVIDKTTKQPIANSNLDISSGNNKKTLDCPNGMVDFEMAYNTDYQFYATAKGYFGNSAKYSTVNLAPGKYEISIELDKIEIGKTFVLRDIYYDLDKWNIRPDAAIELDKVVKVLKENPEVKVELSSHTDCRASHAYNDRLSQRRAESAVKYLVDHGIGPTRLIAKGYGENKLVNRCADGVKCSEAEHQMNRRTELRVLEAKVETEVIQKNNKNIQESQNTQLSKSIIRNQSPTAENKKGNITITNQDKIVTNTNHPAQNEKEYKFLVIGGSFKSEENAEKFIEQLTKQGYKPIRFLSSKNLHTVAVGGYNDKTEADSAMKKYLADNPKLQAWVLAK